MAYVMPGNQKALLHVNDLQHLGFNMEDAKKLGLFMEMDASQQVRVGFVGVGNSIGPLARRLAAGGIKHIVTGLDGHPGFTNTARKEGGLRVLGQLSKQRVPITIGTIPEALSADYTFIGTSSLAHADVAKELAQHDLTNTTLIGMPLNLLVLELRKVLPKENWPKRIIGLSTPPYASRVFNNDATIRIIETKVMLEAASSVPLSDAEKDKFDWLFPAKVAWLPDLASVTMTNLNMITHPAMMLAARGAYAQGRVPELFAEFARPCWETAAALDKVRMGVVAAAGLQTKSANRIGLDWYGRKEATWVNFIEAAPHYGKVPGPSTMDNRYVTEDVGHLLVFTRDFGKCLSVDVKPVEDTIWQFSEILNRDVQVGTFEYFGLEGKPVPEVLDALNGIQPA